VVTDAPEQQREISEIIPILGPTPHPKPKLRESSWIGADGRRYICVRTKGVAIAKKNSAGGGATAARPRFMFQG